MNTRLAILQMESVLGEPAQNAKKILDAAAKCTHAEILITPELALTGFVADYFFNPDFLNKVHQTLLFIAKKAQEDFPHLAIIIGTPFLKNEALLNAAILIHNGSIQKIHAKKPEGFEKRYFTSEEDADICVPIVIKDLTVGFAPPPLVASVALKSAPFNHQKTPSAAPNQIVLNRLGLEVPFIFSGQSHAFNKKSEKIWQAPAFDESLVFLNLQNGALVLEDNKFTQTADFEESAESRIWNALTFALKKYALGNGFKTAVVGLSGGIDSGVVLALAVDALGAENVTALILPSPFTSQESLEDAAAIAQNLNVLTVEIAIASLMKSYEKALSKPFEQLKASKTDTTFENLQARIRGQLLMAYSNRSGAVVLNTSNKSESAVGYSTLYGDLIGGIAPIKDLYKTQVFALAKFRNTLSPVIPQRMIEKPPSAELKPNQKDEDSLPPYDLLDALLAEMIEGKADVPTLLQKGFAPHIIKDVGQRLRSAEFKRRQAPAGFVVSSRGFDFGWHYPIGAHFGENE